MSTYFPKEGDIARKWFVVDAKRTCAWPPCLTRRPHFDGQRESAIHAVYRYGDHVVVINAEKIKITGMKADQKIYHHYTGYPGGIRGEEMKKRLVRKPELIIEDAVSRMLPKNKLGKQMFTS